MASGVLQSDVAATLAAVGGVDPAEVTLDRPLREMDIDSMTLVEVVVSLEDRFGLLIDDDGWSKFTTVGDLVDYLERGEWFVELSLTSDCHRDGRHLSCLRKGQRCDARFPYP